MTTSGRTTGRRIAAALLALLPALDPVAATPTSGSFVYDDELVINRFDLGVTSQVSAATVSWAQGGFAPVLALFDDTSGLLLQLDRGDHVCGDPGAGAADPATGFCWDAFFSTVLPAGHYALVLSQSGNEPAGDRGPGQTFAELYPQTGNVDYTGLANLGQPGFHFISPGGFERNGSWSFDLRSTPLQVPEPALPGLLVVAALALTAATRRGAVRC